MVKSQSDKQKQKKRNIHIRNQTKENKCRSSELIDKQRQKWNQPIKNTTKLNKKQKTEPKQVTTED